MVGRDTLGWQDRDNYPISMSRFPFSDSWSWYAAAGFLSNGHDFMREAGEFGLHNLTTPLHFLVFCHVE